MRPELPHQYVFLLFPNKDNILDPLFLSIFSPFFFVIKVSPNKMHMAFSDSSSCQYFVGHLLLPYYRCTSRGRGEITRRQSSRAAAKIGSYCLENKFRVCGQMVLMVEVCTQVEGSKFLKNTWVWWYSFFRGAKL